MEEPLIPRHGGYRHLKSFKVAQLVFDLTVLFVEEFVDPRSRTCDQMTQAARSGTQNIGEGSQFSATSRKLELKLTNAARSSQEELRLDYEDFLRKPGLPLWAPRHAALLRFKALRCSTVAEVLAWAEAEEELAKTRAGLGPAPSWALTSGRGSPCRSVLLANGALSLLNVSCHLLDRRSNRWPRLLREKVALQSGWHRVRTRARRQKQL